MRSFLLVLAGALVAAAPSLGASRPVGVTTITFTKTSVTTGAPRVLETVVWYPAKPRSGTAEAIGQRDAAIRPGRYPLRFLVEVLGANHLSAVDSCFSQQLGVSLCVPGDISQDDAHRLILHYALPFFRRYVRGQRAAGRVLMRPIPGVVLTADPKHGSNG